MERHKRQRQIPRKVLVRDSDTCSSKLRTQVVLEPSVHCQKESTDSETISTSAQENTCKKNASEVSVLDKAQLHSTRKLLRQLQVLGENTTKPESSSSLLSSLVPRSMTSVNFPLEYEWYRDLVSLDVKDSEVIGPSVKTSKHPIKVSIDPEPRLVEFAKHISRSESISPTSMVASMLEFNDNPLVHRLASQSDFFKTYEQYREWNNTELPFHLRDINKDEVDGSR